MNRGTMALLLLLGGTTLGLASPSDVEVNGKQVTGKAPGPYPGKPSEADLRRFETMKGRSQQEILLRLGPPSSVYKIEERWERWFYHWDEGRITIEMIAGKGGKAALNPSQSIIVGSNSFIVPLGPRAAN